MQNTSNEVFVVCKIMFTVEHTVLNSNRTLSKNYGALGLVQSISGFHS